MNGGSQVGRRLDDARRFAEEALEIYQKLEHLSGVAQGWCQLADVMSARGELKAAADGYARALFAARESRDLRTEVEIQLSWGRCAMRMGELRVAVRHLRGARGTLWRWPSVVEFRREGPAVRATPREADRLAEVLLELSQIRGQACRGWRGWCLHVAAGFAGPARRGRRPDPGVRPVRRRSPEMIDRYRRWDRRILPPLNRSARGPGRV
jgi:tetratricopeptide (TPR) repeat protein